MTINCCRRLATREMASTVYKAQKSKGAKKLKRVRTERARNRADSGSIAPVAPVERLPQRARHRITRPTRKSSAHKTAGQHHDHTT